MENNTDGEISTSHGVHPRVLQVSGDEVHRWCGAIWSIGPGGQQLVGELRSLVESTLAAHWMQPPVEYDTETELVNSFDAVFYDAVSQELAGELEADGWHPVELRGLVIDEYEQFDVFVDEAEAQGRSIGARPDGLWRCEIGAGQGLVDIDGAAFRTRVVELWDDGVWGDTPGWFSRAYCRELASRTDLKVAPDRAGLDDLQDAVVGEGIDGIAWLDPIDYQALCDFIGVVLQATTSFDVQWGTCPVDDETGLAPLPLLRARPSPMGSWSTLKVGRDVIRRVCVPWGDGNEQQRRLTELVADYERRVGGEG